jgi:hypothetical protein
MNPVDDSVNFVALKLCIDALCKESIAGFIFEIHNAFLGITRHLHALDTLSVNNVLHKRAVIRCKVFEACDIDLVDNKQGRLSRKQRFDGVE